MTRQPQLKRQQLEASVLAIHEAGLRLEEARQGVEWSLKPDGSFITRLDGEVQGLLESRLGVIFPGYAFIGEEGPPSPAAGSGPTIIVDPIDGTAAFARGLGHFAISVAVAAAGRPQLAAVHFPALGRWYVAGWSRGQATRYRVTRTDSGLGLVRVPKPPPQLPADTDFANAYLYVGSDAHRRIDLSRFDGKIRALGASAAHLAALVDGTIDPIAVVLTRYRIWDVAAGLALAVAADLELRALDADSSCSLDTLLLGGRPVPLVVGARSILDRLEGQIALVDPAS